MTEQEGIVEYDKGPQMAPGDAFIAMIERVATNPAANIDKMERLYAMRREEMQELAKIAYNKDMVKVQKQIPSIKKEAVNEQTHSKYAKLETIVSKIRPIYTKHGFHLAFSEGDCPTDGMVRILLDVSHIGGEERRFHYDNPVDMAGIKGNVNKTETHGKASGISYGQRYLLNLTFLLDFSGQDDDGNKAGGKVVEYITADQCRKIECMLEDSKLPTKPFADWLLEAKQTKYIDRIPANEYRAVVRRINSAVRAMRKTDATA